MRGGEGYTTHTHGRREAGRDPGFTYLSRSARNALTRVASSKRSAEVGQSSFGPLEIRPRTDCNRVHLLCPPSSADAGRARGRGGPRGPRPSHSVRPRRNRACRACCLRPGAAAPRTAVAVTLPRLARIAIVSVYHASLIPRYEWLPAFLTTHVERLTREGSRMPAFSVCVCRQLSGAPCGTLSS